ncbi:hypothetical protein SG34_009170 [Thalassomonas viridans]|uniref:Uncharacterized protein n=1 Tax=Thalassomonas viridans TaxID=137584 RepID=A0AAF0CBA5_9GAMM|nr:hypothetical protein [Thalassomonas viridans]WDE07035.1 hypothetical protein SG34_009170 [Thalassomonas viridans]
MSENEPMVTYKKNDIIDILKEINLLVVSMNDIGMASIDDANINLAEELLKFLQENDILEKLSEARMILSEPFENEKTEDGNEFLESVMSNLNYWKRKYKAKE